MKKKLATLQKKYSEMTTVQQKFIRYVFVIKIAIFILCAALLALAWYVMFAKNSI